MLQEIGALLDILNSAFSEKNDLLSFIYCVTWLKSTIFILPEFKTQHLIIPLTEYHVVPWLQANSHSVCAMYASTVDQAAFLLTGGTDMRLRYWNLDTPAESFLAISAFNESQSSTSVAYK
jgi:hypothetical protein